MNETSEAITKELTTQDIQNWLYEYIVDVLDVKRADLKGDMSFHNLGLDSSSAVGLISDLTEWSGVAVGVKVLRKHNSIDSLAEYIATNG